MSMLFAGPLDSVCVEALINSEWTIASTTDNVIVEIFSVELAFLMLCFLLIIVILKWLRKTVLLFRSNEF